MACSSRRNASISFLLAGWFVPSLKYIPFGFLVKGLAKFGILPSGSSLVLITARPLGFSAFFNLPALVTRIVVGSTPASISLLTASSNGSLLAKFGMYPAAPLFVLGPIDGHTLSSKGVVLGITFFPIFFVYLEET